MNATKLIPLSLVLAAVTLAAGPAVGLPNCLPEDPSGETLDVGIHCARMAGHSQSVVCHFGAPYGGYFVYAGCDTVGLTPNSGPSVGFGAWGSGYVLRVCTLNGGCDSYHLP